MFLPSRVGTFEFVVISGLRAAQLMRGCTPRLQSTHKRTVVAQMEVAAGEIVRVPEAAASRPSAK